VGMRNPEHDVLAAALSMPRLILVSVHSVY
jgi:hypothetical protein